VRRLAPRHAIGVLAGLSFVPAAPASVRADDDARALASPFDRERAPSTSIETPRSPDDDAPPEFALDITAIAVLPITVGGRVAFEMPGHFVVYASGGLVPIAIIDGINDVGTGWGLWNETDARIAQTMLGDATWFEVGLGIRPSGTPGIEITVGYSLIWSHRLATLGTLWPGGTALLDTSGRDSIGMDVTIDSVRAELAWQTELFDGLSFRAALGWIHAVRHDVSIVSNSDDPRVVEGLEALETALDDELGRRAFGPTLSFALGIHL
jgi:hypothetical protein